MINDNVVDKLVKGGLYTINIGIQSGSDSIRNKIFHRPGKNDEIVNIANNVVKKNVKIVNLDVIAEST